MVWAPKQVKDQLMVIKLKKEKKEIIDNSVLLKRELDLLRDMMNYHDDLQRECDYYIYKL